MKNNIFLRIVLIITLFVNTCFAEDGYFLTLYSFPPEGDLNWKTPHTLLFSMNRNRLIFTNGIHKRTIGHCFIGIQAPDGYSELVGSIEDPKNPSSKSYVIKHGYGLGVLLAPIKGAFDKKEKLNKELQQRYETGRVTFIKFKISKSNFERMKTYINEYRKRGYNKIYNGHNKPREGLGAGCSAFAMSFLDLGNLIDPVFEKEWIRNINLPKSLVGGPITGNKVSLQQLIFSKNWAKENEPHIKLSLYSPQLIYYWVHNLLQELRLAKENGRKSEYFSILGQPLQFLIKGKAIGLYVDVSYIEAPNTPIWLGKAANYENNISCDLEEQ